jgi:HEAT repeat protein
MRKRRKFALLVFCLAVLLVGGTLLWPDDEPCYQGRSLFQWLSVFTTSAHEDCNRPECLEAKAAVRLIGTNAIPALLRAIQHEPRQSRVRAMVCAGVDRLPSDLLPQRVLDWIEIEPAELRASRAVIGFEALGSNGVPAIPRLFQLATNATYPRTAGRATQALGGIGLQALPQLLTIITNPAAPDRYAAMLPLRSFGADGLPAVPILLRCLDDPSDDVSYGATSVLARMNIPEATKVAGLIRAAKEAHPPIARATAAQVLSRFTNSASEVIPALRTALSDTNEFVRMIVTNALLRLAPSQPANTTPGKASPAENLPNSPR